jgi:photosystem II stability/assembly factor-like uncharacterized protein
MRSVLIPLAAVLVLCACGSQAPLAAGPAASAPVASTGTATASPATSPAGQHPDCAGSSAGQAFEDLGANALTDVQFVSASQGWVVGRRVILATSNGGATWTPQDHGHLNLMSVDFVSSDTGWAVGPGTLLHTTDGGGHWTALPEPCPQIRSVHFLSPTVGFAIAGGSGPQAVWTAAPPSGGTVLTTTNGGSSWHQVAAPANAQSVCFSGDQTGWLGADGGLYYSADGGRTWTMQARGPSGQAAGGAMLVQCAQGGAWGMDIGPGAAMSQEPHIGYHASPTGATPIFAEQYFPHPGVTVKTEAPGSYSGPVSALSSSAAVYIDYCPACGWGSAPWDLVTSDGATLTREGNVGGLSQANGASFVSPSAGWVVGVERGNGTMTPRIVRTQDGGHTWQVQYR